MTISKLQQANAADDLEEIAIAMKEVVRQLRMGVDDGLAHALLWELRQRSGKIIRSYQLGIGVPRSEHWIPAKDIIDAQIWSESVQ